MTSTNGNLSSYFNLSKNNGIIVGNGHSIPICGFDSANLPLPHPPLVLGHVVHPLKLIENLISILKSLQITMFLLNLTRLVFL